MDEWSAGTLLADLVDEPPASRVDVDRAISSAKRKHRRRRTGALLAAVTVVVAGLLMTLLPGVRPGPVADAPGSTLRPQNPRAPFLFSPSRLQMRLDWRPFEVERVKTETDGTYQRLTLLGAITRTDGDAIYAPIAQIVLHGEGQWEPGEDKAAQKAPAIYKGGGTSYWIAKPKESTSIGQLLWFWAPSAWASVDVYNSKQPEALAVRLAQALRTDQDTVVRMPFTVQPPSGLKLAHTVSVTGPSGYYAVELRFGPVNHWVLQNWAAVTATNDVMAVKAGRPYYQIENTPPDDDRAEVWPGTLTALQATPKDQVTGASMATTVSAGSLISAARARLMAASVRLSADPAQARTWTASYLR